MTNAKNQDSQNGNQADPAQVINTMQNADSGIDHQTEEQQAEKKRANARTEAEAQSVDGKAGQSGKSSHDHMGHIEAGSHEGAGGGAKAGRNH